MSTLYRKIQRKRLKNGLHGPVTLGVSLREVWTENGEYRDADTMSHYASVKSSWAQRNTFIETKNRTLQCLKRHYSTVWSMKNVAVLTEDGAFALFFRPHPRGVDSSRVSTPGNLPSTAKKMLMPGGHLRKNVKWRERTDSFDNYRGEDLLLACVASLACLPRARFFFYFTHLFPSARFFFYFPHLFPSACYAG